MTLTLVDANGQAVESKTVSSNAYGSAAGEFAIPAGRALGAWSVRCATGGAASIRVEEYKRPTFETTLDVPKDPLRLNRPATFRGEARYYFGLPVTNGSVAWRVTREAEYPWWWWGWWGGGRPAGAETVATGTASLAADGTFAVTFTPKADERAGKDVTYRYRLSADVTDEGGETRSAERSFRLGFVSVRARRGEREEFLPRRKERRERRSSARTSTERPAPAREPGGCCASSSPEKTLLPAEFPSKQSENGGSVSETGAALNGSARERREQGVPDARRPAPPALVDRLFRRPVAARVEGRCGDGVGRRHARREGRGEARAAGAARGRLPPALLDRRRLRGDVRDGAGLPRRGAKAAPALPLVLLAESSSVKVGGVARFLVASGIRGQALYLDVARAGKLIERRILRAGTDAALIEIPITEEDRGGFGVTLTAVRDHQFLQQTQTVFVPWDDRELKVTFATFRDRLRPGQTETWRVTVKGATREHPLAETAELLAYMYDRSLDVFAPHRPPSPLSLYPNRATPVTWRATLGAAQAAVAHERQFSAPALVGRPHASTV